MAKIYCRVVEDDFSDEDGQNWMVDVLIQTTDPSDFDSFDDAVEECVDRIQERIDAEEDKESPDAGYLDKLREKLEDSNVSDWDEYTSALSQPIIDIGNKGINPAEVKGRRQIQRHLDAGGTLDDRCQRIWDLIVEQSKPGGAKPKERLKLLKERPRPPMTFVAVKIEPTLANLLTPAQIKGLLLRHKDSYERQEWKAVHSGTISDLGSEKHPDCYFHVMTVFLDSRTCVTFVTVVSKGHQPPDDDATMKRATADFRWDATDDQGRASDWRPEFN